MKRLTLPLLTALACLVSSGCAHDEESHNNNTPPTGKVEACGGDTDVFAPGLVLAGAKGQVKVTLLQSEPQVLSKGDHQWRVMVSNANGAAMPDAVLAVTPFMPEHNHGTTVAAAVTKGAVPGEFVLNPVNLFMVGLWRVTIDVTDQAAEDSVVFRVCVKS